MDNNLVTDNDKEIVDKTKVKLNLKNENDTGNGSQISNSDKDFENASVKEDAEDLGDDFDPKDEVEALA